MIETVINLEDICTEVIDTDKKSLSEEDVTYILEKFEIKKENPELYRTIEFFIYRSNDIKNKYRSELNKLKPNEENIQELIKDTMSVLLAGFTSITLFPDHYAIPAIGLYFVFKHVIERLVPSKERSEYNKLKTEYINTIAALFNTVEETLSTLSTYNPSTQS